MTLDAMEREIAEHRIRLASLEAVERDQRRTIDRLDAVLADLQHQVKGLIKDAQRNGSQNVTRRLPVVPSYRTLGEKLSDDDGA